MTAYPVAAIGHCAFAGTDVPSLRRQAVSTPALALMMRYADEQTLVALATVRQTMQDAGWNANQMRSFGVVVAPRYFGRHACSTGFEKFGRQGPSTLSAMIIPSYCLHASAGTLSVMLGMHGPNFGAGSGPNHVADGFLTAFSLQEERLAPGLWLVLTALDPEPTFNPPAGEEPPYVIHGVAIALSDQLPAAISSPGGRLRIGVDCASNMQTVTLMDLISFVHSDRASWQCSLPGGMALALERDLQPAARGLAA